MRQSQFCLVHSFRKMLTVELGAGVHNRVCFLWAGPVKGKYSA